MRKYLLIFVCAFSFCAHAETNIVVELDYDQYSSILSMVNFLKTLNGIELRQSSDGSFSFIAHPLSSQRDVWGYLTGNQVDILQFLHLLFTGNMQSGYNVASNNILAYASSLRSHNADVRALLDSIDANTHGTWLEFINFSSRVGNIYNSLNAFHSDYNAFHSDYSNNFERLYEVITNFDFNVSISNQIDILQSLAGISQRVDGGFNNIHDVLDNDLFPIREDMNRNHGELMVFLHSLSNGSFFASNLVNCCCANSNNQEAVSNFQDSVVAMLSWMTNRWAEGSTDPTVGFGNSNTVWSVWRPSDEGWSDLLIPNVVWDQDSQIGGWRPLYKPRDEQYDGNFKRIATQYYNLLKNYEAGDIDGQKFFAGLVDLQLHIIANMSTQLYMIDEKMPTKTNLWQWIEQYKSEVQERVTQAQDENSSAASSASALLDYTPFSIVGGHFPRVSSALNSLRVDNDSSPVVRIPIPQALRVSDSDELIVDVRESDWFISARNWCRWIFTFIWGWLFIRLGLVPIFYVFFFTVRVAEISAHLVFMGSIRGSSGIVSSFGASAVDMILSLIGIDTDFKKFVWGIMRD